MLIQENIKVGVGGINTIETEKTCEHGYTQTISVDYVRENPELTIDDVKILGGCPLGCHKKEN